MKTIESQKALNRTEHWRLIISIVALFLLKLEKLLWNGENG